MNEPIYVCPKCANLEAFTELVWEQRKYPIDGYGNTSGVSDVVEDTEVSIEVTCDHCGAIVVQHGTAPPQNHEYLKQVPQYWEDPPAYTDFEDTDSKYQAQFMECIATDDVYEFDTILQEYAAAHPDKRFVVNWLFIRLCGYSLPSIVKKAHGHEPDDDKDHHEQNGGTL